jgi:hypothetical protein
LLIFELFKHYYKDGNMNTYTTNSLSVVDAITHLHMSFQDKLIWRLIFQKMFNKSIADQLADR